MFPNAHICINFFNPISKVMRLKQTIQEKSTLKYFTEFIVLTLNITVSLGETAH